MSSLFGTTTSTPTTTPTVPSFLASTPAPAAAPAPVATAASFAPDFLTTSLASPQDQLQSLRTEIKALMDQLNQVSAALAAATPAPAPAPAPVAVTQSPVGVFNAQDWSFLNDVKNVLSQFQNLFSNIFPPAPAPTPSTPATPSQPSNPSAPVKSPKGKTEFVISSFNVLGSSHTKAGGEKPQMASGVQRIRGAVQLLNQYKVSVAGLQEFQDDQAKEFKRLAGNTYGMFSGKIGKKTDTDNTIVWRKDQWDLVKGSYIDVPYFEGHVRKMPVVRLKNKQTGQEAYFINVHNPANTKKHPNNEANRDEATRREVALMNKLMKDSGLPVFFVGDMNEKEEVNQHVKAGSPMVSASEKGGKLQKVGIDWIFGSKGAVKFSNYIKDRGALVQRTSDHPIIVTKATIGG